jgi:hypothetical protein
MLLRDLKVGTKFIVELEVTEQHHSSAKLNGGLRRPYMRCSGFPLPGDCEVTPISVTQPPRPLVVGEMWTKISDPTIQRIVIGLYENLVWIKGRREEVTFSYNADEFRRLWQ